MPSSPAFCRASALSLFVVLATVVSADLLPTAPEEKPENLGPLAFTVAVPENRLSLKQIHAAVVNSAMRREWLVKDNSETRPVIYLLHRGNEATVTFLITEKSVEAYCVGFAVDKAGNRKKPEQPTGWLKYLNRDITKAIETAVRLQVR
jgi:hypothetical protein